MEKDEKGFDVEYVILETSNLLKKYQDTKEIAFE